jgi:PilZ domain/SPOR domain
MMMERRHHDRFAVNLNVALLDDRAMPRGCRVRDVSQGGMLLQFEHPDGGNRYEPGQTVRVRASLKDGEERRVLVLPAAVRRVEEKAIGVEFAKPAAELMQLLEPYQLDRAIPAREPAMAAERVRTADGAPVFAEARPQRPSYSESNRGARLRLAERIAAMRESIAANAHTAPSATPPPASLADRRVLMTGLASLAIAVAIVIFDLAAGSATRQRLAALETAMQRQAEVLADVQIRLAADREQRRLAALDKRVSQLAASLAALETGEVSSAGTAPDSPHEAKEAKEAVVASAVAPAPVDRSKTTPPPVAGPASDSGGPWVINLVSLYDKTAADRFSRRAEKLGIKVTQNPTQVQGRPVWRLQVDGFATRDAAVAYSEANKDKLGLKKVWIFSR